MYVGVCVVGSRLVSRFIFVQVAISFVFEIDTYLIAFKGQLIKVICILK